jgi:hypothetical protein
MPPPPTQVAFDNVGLLMSVFPLLPASPDKAADEYANTGGRPAHLYVTGWGMGEGGANINLGVGRNNSPSYFNGHCSHHFVLHQSMCLGPRVLKPHLLSTGMRAVSPGA